MVFVYLRAAYSTGWLEVYGLVHPDWPVLTHSGLVLNV